MSTISPAVSAVLTFGPRMVCTRCGIIGADARPNFSLLQCNTPLPRWAKDRDRGEPRGSAPPTPPCVRVRTRRFEKLRYTPTHVSTQVVLDSSRKAQGFGEV